MAKDNKETTVGTETTTGNRAAPQFSIQRLYVKDMTFQSTQTPGIFNDKWDPQVSLNIDTETQALGKNLQEVVLAITVTVKDKEKEVFSTTVKQAGVFSLENFTEDQIKPILGSFCPSILYPYARETATGIASKGGFPQLYLTPINFDALYQQKVKQQGGADTTAATR